MARLNNVQLADSYIKLGQIELFNFQFCGHWATKKLTFHKVDREPEVVIIPSIPRSSGANDSADKQKAAQYRHHDQFTNNSPCRPPDVSAAVGRNADHRQITHSYRTNQ